MSFNEYNKYKISDAAEVITGFPFKGEKYSSKGIRVVRGENVTIGNLRWDSIKCWNEPFKEIEKYSLTEGDIVIGMDGSRVGRNRAQIKKNDLPLILAQRVARLRANEDFSQDFISYVIKSTYFEQYVESIKTGTSIPHISPQQIKDFEFTAPKKDAQIKIAKILSSLDEKIELNRQTNQTLETLAQTLFKEMCVSKSEVLPNGWKAEKLDNLIETVSVTHKMKQEEIIFLNTSDILEGNVLNNDYSVVSTLPGQAKKSIKRNDILFSEIRPANKRYAFVNFDADDYVVSTKLMVLRSKGINPYLIYCFLTNNDTLKELQHLAETRSGTFPQITFSQLKEFQIVIPDKETLDKVSKNIQDIYENIFLNNKETQTLIALRYSLLPKLMKGEIVL